MDGKEMYEMKPWYKGFKGDVYMPVAKTNVQVHAVISNDTLETIDILAEIEGRTRSQMISRILTIYSKNEKPKLDYYKKEKLID